MIKTGEQHIASLRDGREIYLDGELVDDVTTHPAFRGAVASIGRIRTWVPSGRVCTVSK